MTQLPKHIQKEMHDYIEKHKMPSGYVMCLLMKDFETASKVRPISLMEYFNISTYIHKDIPRESWGDDRAITNWCRRSK